MQNTKINVNGREMEIERVRKMAELGDAEAKAALQRHAERTSLSTALTFITYTVAASQLGKFQKHMEKMSRLVSKANKRIAQIKSDKGDSSEAASIPEPRWTVGEPEAVEHDGCLYLYHTAHVSLSPIKIPGDYRLIARVDVNKSDKSGSTNVVHRVSGYAGNLPDAAWCGKMCDHCKKNRRRNVMFILEDASGKQFRVAKNCSEEFFGVDGTQLLRALGVEAAMQEESASGKWGHTQEDSGVDHVAFLALMAGNKHITPENAFALARSLHYYGSTGTNQGFIDTYTPSHESTMKAVAMMEWIGAQEPRSELWKNIKGACSFPLLQAKHTHLVARLAREWKPSTVSETPSFSVNFLRFSRHRGLNIHTVKTTFSGPVLGRWLAEFKAMVPLQDRFWDQDKGHWMVYTQPTRSHISIPRLVALCERHAGTEATQAPSAPTPATPEWSVVDGFYSVSLGKDRSDQRFMQRCWAVLPAEKVMRLSVNNCITSDRESAREAYKQALWCLRNPQS